ncbi:MAG: HEAT repeat domain-containing protein [Halobacteriovoraceae bacterium]|nr:HEAT repeat domain-containing protein [Halobacteriovoraceae bacterium]
MRALIAISFVLLGCHVYYLSTQSVDGEPPLNFIKYRPVSTYSERLERKDWNSSEITSLNLALKKLGGINSQDSEELEKVAPAVKKNLVIQSTPENERDEDYYLSSLYNEDSEEQRNALIALARMKSRRAIASIAELVWKSNSDLAVQAAISLKEIDPLAADEVLLTAVEDSNPEVVANALMAMGQTDHKDLDEYISEALESQNVRVQLGALETLGQVSDTTVIPFLEELSRSSEGEFREKVNITILSLAAKAHTQQMEAFNEN